MHPPSSSSSSVAVSHLPIKHPGHAVKSSQDVPSYVCKADIYEVLGKSEVERADKMYRELEHTHLVPPPAFYMCIDQISELNTMIGFRRTGDREPVLIYIKDGYGNPPPKGGGFGTVYESHRLSKLSDGRWVLRSGPEHERVMKVQDESPEASSEAEFLVEQRGTLGTGVIGGKRYLDQIKAAGVDLDEHFLRGEWTEEQRFKCAVSILSSLTDYIASNHVHPDIKPQNMMYDPESGVVQLIDNAHVVNRDEHPSMLNRPGFNTYFYASPEQFLEGKFSEKTMVYSAGIMLLNLFSDNPSAHDVAESMPETKRGIKLNLDNFLPKLRKEYEVIVSHLENLFLDMVMSDEKGRPAMRECLDRLKSCTEVYNLKLQHSDEMKKMQEELNILQRQKKSLEENNQRKSRKERERDLKAIQELEKKCTAHEKRIASTLRHCQVELEKATEPLRKELEQAKLQTSEWKGKADLRERELKEVKIANSELSSQLEVVMQQVKEIEKTSTEQISQIHDQDRKLAGLRVRITESEKKLKREELARREADERKLMLESDLKVQKETHLEAARKVDKLSEMASQLEVKQRDTEADLKTTRQALLSEKQAPLQAMLQLACDNPSGAVRGSFAEMLPGAFSHLPLKARSEFLTELFVKIITNEKLAGQIDLPYAPTERWLWASNPQRKFDLSQSQMVDLSVVHNEAEKLLRTGLKGSEEDKKMVCRWLDRSPVFSCPRGQNLNDGFTFYHRMQSLLSEIPGAWRYRDQGARPPAWLADQLNDGRRGKPESPKAVPDFMTKLSSNMSLNAADMQLFHKLNSPSFKDKMMLLEEAFNHVTLSPGKYTRTDSISGAYYPPRQDIAGASRTQIEHAVTLQGVVRLLIEEREKIGTKLTSEEIKLLCESRLIKFNPVQYHSEVEFCSSELAIAAQKLCENAQNFDELRRYLIQRH